MTALSAGTAAATDGVAGPRGEPLLELRDAAVRFGPRTVLGGASLTLHRGERLALVGPNGGGKTTLLRLLHGLVPCSAGQRLTPGAEPRIAMVFQKPFVLSLSARANVALALWLHGRPAAQRRDRTAQALARVGLSAQAGQRATTLSGGQQQRLTLARAWALQPDMLLLDEPTASLDPGAKREVEGLIESLGTEGLTLVFSSHNLGQVKRLATRVLYLEEGAIRADERVDRFFDPNMPSAATPFLRGELRWV
jgi:tungstate transport system ATP-binding protein